MMTDLFQGVEKNLDKKLISGKRINQAG